MSLMRGDHMGPEWMLSVQDVCGGQADFAEMAREHKKSGGILTASKSGVRLEPGKAQSIMKKLTSLRSVFPKPENKLTVKKRPMEVAHRVEKLATKPGGSSPTPGPTW